MNVEDRILRYKVQAASSLLGRVKEKNLPIEDRIEKDASRIFYWILLTLGSSIESTYPGKKKYTLNITVTDLSLIVGNLYKPSALLHSFHCNKKADFYLAIERAVDTFNCISGYHAGFKKENHGLIEGNVTVSISIS